jgi:hypothetical protein
VLRRLSAIVGAAGGYDDQQLQSNQRPTVCFAIDVTVAVLPPTFSSRTHVFNLALAWQ